MTAYNIAIFEHQTPSDPPGQDGGSLLSLQFNIRPINTEIFNTIPGCSLATNSINLLSGTYCFYAWACAVKVQGNDLTIYDSITDTFTRKGTTQHSSDFPSLNNVTTLIVQDLTFTQNANIELWHYADETNLTNGMGTSIDNTTGEPNVFCHIFIKKLD